MKRRWYITCWSIGHGDGRLPGKEEAVWTLSRKPHECGWRNDCDCKGYGLTYSEAEELADAANAAWETRRGR